VFGTAEFEGHKVLTHRPSTGGKTQDWSESTLESLVNFQNLRVLVVHPRDADGEMLLRQLHRLRCEVDHCWPGPERAQPSVDVAFCLVDPQTRNLCNALIENKQTAVAGVIDPSDPRALQELVQLSPSVVVVKPLDPVAILTNLVVAHNNSSYLRRLQSKLSKLEETLRSVRKVERAKAILMQNRQISESEAYAYLREQAMRKRVPIGMIASVIVESETLLFGKSD
jgi:AmiR/NasT family two-component response regulator